MSSNLYFLIWDQPKYNKNLVLDFKVIENFKRQFFLSSVTFKTMLLIFRHFLNYFPVRSNTIVENNRETVDLFFKSLNSAFLKSMGIFRLI